MFPYNSSNGVQYAYNQPLAHHPNLLMKIDWDATVAFEKPVHDAEAIRYPEFFASFGLPNIYDVLKQFGQPCDILFWPILAWEFARRNGTVGEADRHRLLSEVIPAFLQTYEDIESVVKPHPGAVAAIAQIRREHPYGCLIVFTQCPWHLGLGRMKTTGMAHLFDGIVGVRQERPSILDDYRHEIAFIDQWLYRKIETFDLARYVVVAGVPDAQVKPADLHSQVAMLAANPGDYTIIIGVDDKPRRMEPIIARHRLRRKHPSFYLHAQVSTFEKATKESVDGSFTAMDQLPGLVNRFVESTTAAA
jgi:hypothetical protein